MEGGLDNVAREVDAERFNFREKQWKKVEIQKQFLKILFGNDD